MNDRQIFHITPRSHWQQAKKLEIYEAESLQIFEPNPEGKFVLPQILKA